MQGEIQIPYGQGKETSISWSEIHAGLRRIIYYTVKNIDCSFKGDYEKVHAALRNWKKWEGRKRAGLDYKTVYADIEKLNNYFGLERNKMRTLFGRKHRDRTSIILNYLVNLAERDKDFSKRHPLCVFTKVNHGKCYHKSQFKNDDCTKDGEKKFESLKGHFRYSYPTKYLPSERALARIYKDKKLHDRIVDFDGGFLEEEDIRFVKKHFLIRTNTNPPKRITSTGSSPLTQAPEECPFEIPSNINDNPKILSQRKLQSYVDSYYISAGEATSIANLISWLRGSKFKEARHGFTVNDADEHLRERLSIFGNLVDGRNIYGLSDEKFNHYNFVLSIIQSRIKEKEAANTITAPSH